VTNARSAHFIGIGGAGMSAVARVFHDQGGIVTGSDLKRSRYSEQLEDAGIIVYIGHDASQLGDPDMVVVSSAITPANPEYAEAVRRGLPIWQRARMLAELSGDKKTVAVAGTHGKTTTSTMLAVALAGLGADPTFLIGGQSKDLGSNSGSGAGPFYVVEADESDGSFLHLTPWLAMVTNIEADHLDFYDGIEHVERTFEQFLAKVIPGGVAVVCADDARLARLATACECPIVTYGLAEGADVRLLSVQPEGLGSRYRVRMPDGHVIESVLPVPGAHMAVNLAGVLACVHALGLDPDAAAERLKTYKGVRRRFDTLGEVGGVRIVDDYAHHPTEVAATLAGAQDAGFDRVWAVFQPHRYSRTEALSREFGEAFSDADHIVLMDVYSAGETPIPGVSGKTLVNAVLETEPRTDLAYFPHRAEIVGYLADRVRPGDLVMTMGAGDVNMVGGELVRELEGRSAMAAGTATATGGIGAQGS
jgi:UDP-N-acetylmuramate--alanine ligase